MHLGELELAAEAFRAAANCDTPSLESLNAFGEFQLRRQRFDDALDIGKRCLRLSPGSRDALLTCGNAELGLGDLGAADDYLRRAIEADPSHALSWMKLGMVRSAQSRVDEAIEAFERSAALDSDPDSDLDAFANLAIELDKTGDSARAAEIYVMNLPTRQSPKAFFNFGLFCLGAGHLGEGWHYNEFRWMLEPLRSMRPAYDRPAWDGQSLSDKTILVRGEQGFGDNFQFLRYAPFLRACGARVLLRPRAGMERIANDIPGIDRVIDSATLEEFDYYTHVMSLPRVFGTRVDSIPPQAPALAVDPECALAWRDAIKSGTDLKVGIVWAGSSDHADDAQRSVPLHQFEVLFSVPSTHFYSLQMGAAATTLKQGNYTNVSALGERIRSFNDTAGILSLLDLTICVDTSVAHLAGSMGLPVWLLNAKPGDWRWRGSLETTAWYPSMRIFHQRTRGDWGEMLGRVREALARVGRYTAATQPKQVRISGSTLTPRDPVKQMVGFVPMGAVAETRFGIVQYVPDGSRVSEAIRWYGEYLSDHLKIIGPLISPGSTVVEIGSGPGLWTLAIAAKVGPSGHVIAFEPDPRLRRILRNNVSANAVRNVTVLRQSAPFAGVESGQPTENHNCLEVDALRLGSAALLIVNDTVDAGQMAQGATETLWRLRPAVFAHQPDNQLSGTAAVLRDHGYRCWRISAPLFDVGNFNARPENIFGEDVAHAVLAVPEELDLDVDVRPFVELR
jgi:SAM-dependent methyltransferase